MLRTLYDKVLELSNRKWALSTLGLVCFLESSIFPIPPDILLIPLVLANRSKALKIATVATLTSVFCNCLNSLKNL